MRVGLALLVFVAPAIAGAAGPPIDASETQIRGALSEMHQAASALDADRFMNWYLQDPSLTITFDGHIMRGWEVIRDQQRRWWSASTTKLTYIEDMPPEVRLLGPDVATTLQSMTIGGDIPQGAAKPTHLTVTSVWKKRPEGWRIVIAHESISQ